MAQNNRTIEDIDEAALLQSIYERDNPLSVLPQEDIALSAADKPEPLEKSKEAREMKEPVRRKRSGNQDYSSSFLQRNELKARSCVYISQKVHDTISKIVRFIADKEVTVGGYIDNVLLQHLEAHKDEINGLYKREREDLIEF
jgi:hypothetical protein